MTVYEYMNKYKPLAFKLKQKEKKKVHALNLDLKNALIVRDKK